MKVPGLEDGDTGRGRGPRLGVSGPQALSEGLSPPPGLSVRPSPPGGGASQVPAAQRQGLPQPGSDSLLVCVRVCVRGHVCL